MAENTDVRWLQRYDSFKKALKKLESVTPKVRKVILFCSRAKGNYRTGSDIDLALVGSDVDHEELLK